MAERYYSKKPNNNGSKVKKVTFEVALKETMEKTVVPEEFSKLATQIKTMKLLPELMRLYPLSKLTYEQPFTYYDSKQSETKTLRKEVSNIVAYMTSIYSIYSDLKQEAERNALEKLALDRITASEKTKKKSDITNSGKNTDDEHDEGSNAGMLGYIEGDVAGITPEMHNLMNQVEKAFEIMSDQSIKTLDEKDFSPEAVADHALSSSKRYTAEQLNDILTAMLRLRESLPNLDKEFSVDKITRDTKLSTSFSKVASTLKNQLKDNPYFVAQETINNLFGPNSMDALRGVDQYSSKDGKNAGKAPVAKIFGTLEDPTKSKDLVNFFESAINSSIAVYENNDWTNEANISAFFLGGKSYNVSRSNKYEEINKMRAELQQIKDEYIKLGGKFEEKEFDKAAAQKEIEHLKAQRNNEKNSAAKKLLDAEIAKRECFLKGYLLACKEQESVLYRAMNSVQKMVYSTDINENILKKVDDLLTVLYPYTEKTVSGYSLNPNTKEFFDGEQGRLKEEILYISKSLGMEEGVDYKGGTPTIKEVDRYMEEAVAHVFSSNLEERKEYFDVLRKYIGLYEDSVQSQNKQIDITNLLIDPIDPKSISSSKKNKIPSTIAFLDYSLKNMDNGYENAQTLIKSLMGENDRDLYDNVVKNLGDNKDLISAIINGTVSKESRINTLDDSLLKGQVNEFVERMHRQIGALVLSLDDKKMIHDKLDFSGANAEEKRFAQNTDEQYPSPLTDALRLYMESERRVRILSSLSNENDELKSYLTGAIVTNKERLENLKNILIYSDGKNIEKTVAEKYSGALSVFGENKKELDEKLADSINKVFSSIYAHCYTSLCNEINAYGEMTEPIIETTKDLKNENLKYLTDFFSDKAKEKGLDVKPLEFEKTITKAFNSLWDTKKCSAAISKAISTYNQYGVRGYFADKVDNIDNKGIESRTYFNSGSGTFIGVKDIADFILDFMPNEIKDLQQLYDHYVKIQALPESEEKKFHDAHNELIENKISELNRKEQEINSEVEKNKKILECSFNPITQYRVGMELKKLMETADLNEFAHLNSKIKQRMELKEEVVSAYNDMKDIIRAMATNTPVMDLNTGEVKAGKFPDVENKLFLTAEINEFLVKAQLEKEAPGSYGYQNRERDFKFFKRLVEKSEADVKARFEQWDKAGILGDPSQYTPSCIKKYLEARAEYDKFLENEMGMDSRFETLKNNCMVFAKNNPVDSFSTAATNYFDAVEKGEDKAYIQSLYKKMKSSVIEAPYMGAEAKKLARVNKNVSEHDIVETAKEYDSDRKKIVDVLNAKNDELEKIREQKEFLSVSHEAIFSIVATAIPDTSLVEEILKDRIGTFVNLQDVEKSMLKITESTDKAFERYTGCNWMDYKVGMKEYVNALLSRMDGKNVSDQMETLRKSLLVAPAKMVLNNDKTFFDEKGYWNVNTNIADPVLANSFNFVRNYIVNLNESIINGKAKASDLESLLDAKVKTSELSLKDRRDAMLKAFKDEVRKADGALSVEKLNALLENEYKNYKNFCLWFADKNKKTNFMASQFFNIDEKGVPSYKNKEAFERMIKTNERFKDGKGRASVISFVEQLGEIPITIEKVKTSLFLKDLGKTISEKTGSENELKIDVSTSFTKNGSPIYSVNLGNTKVNTGNYNGQYCGMLFRTHGNSGINKEAVLAMLAMKTGMDFADYTKEDLKGIRGSLDPAKWEIVNDSESELTGLVMLRPKKDEYINPKVSDFISKNPLYTTEGEVKAQVSMDYSGIKEMRYFMQSKIKSCEYNFNKAQSKAERDSINQIKASYKKEIELLDELERMERIVEQKNKSIFDDEELVNKFISEEITDETSSFVGSFNNKQRLSELLDEKAPYNETTAFNDGLNGEVSKHNRNKASDYGKRPATSDVTIEQKNIVNIASQKPSGVEFAKSQNQSSAEIVKNINYDKMTANTTEREPFISRKATSVKSIFDAAFKPIDEKGTPLYKDPKYFGVLLTFIHDNLRSENRESFYMTGGPLLDESYVAAANEGSLNLYEALANNDGDNEIAYLVYKEMFEAANVSILLNSKNIVSLADDGENMSTDEALIMSENESNGVRNVQNGETVMKSISLEYFPGYHTFEEINEYGVNNEKDALARSFASDAEKKKSVSDDSNDSIYAKLEYKGVQKFENFWELMNKNIAGEIENDEKRELRNYVPSKIKTIGRPDLTITNEHIEDWFRTWQWSKSDVSALESCEPTEVPLNKKIAVLQNLLPLCGIEHSKEGSECRKENMSNAISVLTEAINNMSISPEQKEAMKENIAKNLKWEDLTSFYNSVTDVYLDENGLPDYKHFDIDVSNMSNHAKNILKPILEDTTGTYKESLYENLATTGFIENIIPENMLDVLEIIGTDEDMSISFDEYSKSFEVIFKEQIENYSLHKSFVDYFSENDKAEALYEKLKALDAAGKMNTVEIRDFIKGMMEETNDEIINKLTTSVEPDERLSVEENAKRIAKDLVEQLRPTNPGIKEKDLEEVSNLIVKGYLRDINTLTYKIDRYITAKLREAKANGEKPSINKDGFNEFVKTCLSNSAIDKNRLFTSKITNTILMDISRASSNKLYNWEQDGHDINVIKDILKNNLMVYGNYLGMALGAYRDEFKTLVGTKDANAVASVAKTITKDKWNEILYKLDEYKKYNNLGQSFRHIADNIKISPHAFLKENFGLKEDFSDTLRNYIYRYSKSNEYKLDSRIVAEEYGRIKDVMLNAKMIAAGEKIAVKDLMTPYCLIPTHGIFKDNEWVFDKFVVIYSKERAEKIIKEFEKYKSSLCIQSVLGNINLRTRDIQAMMEKAKDEKERAEIIKKIVGEEEYGRIRKTVSFFGGLNSDEIKRLPQNISDIKKTYFNEKIDPEVIAEIKRESRMEESVRNSGSKTEGLSVENTAEKANEVGGENDKKSKTAELRKKASVNSLEKKMRGTQTL